MLSASESGLSIAYTAFFRESIGHIVPWMTVAACVIVCDLVVGIRKSLMMNEEVRFSTACRRTLGKMVSYFTFVIMVAVIDVAANGGGTIDKWACLAVCLIEFSSIMSNILKPKGIEINVAKLLAIVFGKKYGVEKKDIEEMFEKNNHQKGGNI